MNKGRKRSKRLLSILLCTALVMSGIIVPTKQAQAEETQVVDTISSAKTIAGLGTGVIADPIAPVSETDAWKGNYVYYGNYDADGDGIAEPMKYRVLDAKTTDFGGTTMFLDCDSILYSQRFDEDGDVNAGCEALNDWVGSDVYNNLNGDGFLNKSGVFSAVEKNTIASSTKASHTLNDDTVTTVDVTDWVRINFAYYTALSGEQIFLLDVEDVCNQAYGYGEETVSCEKQVKTPDSASAWWLRTARAGSGHVGHVGYVYPDGDVAGVRVNNMILGVCPAFNLKLSSVLFSSVVSGAALETGAEYKLTLLDNDVSIALDGDVTRNGNTLKIPYSIGGTNSGNVSQVSVLILDKEYTSQNANNAEVLDYQSLAVVDEKSLNEEASYTLPDSLKDKRLGMDYYAYIIAEDVNEEKETDYASEPVAISWAVPEVKQINFGTQGIFEPAVPNSVSDAWKGCYVWYGNYDTDSDGTAEPMKYRVLDANTTKYGGTTMLLDCESVLYKIPFDGTSPYSKVWKDSSLYAGLNGNDFLNKEGVFTLVEKNAILTSNVESHELNNEAETMVSVTQWVQDSFVEYVALTGEQIFMLDAEDTNNEAYGYSMTDGPCTNHMKSGFEDSDLWWLRSASCIGDYDSGYVGSDGSILIDNVFADYIGVSPAFNLKRSAVLFSSADTNETSFAGKTSVLTGESNEIGVTTNTGWKLTLKDDKKSVALSEGKVAIKESDGTITVPYTYMDSDTSENKVNQISVMITDKAYDPAKETNEQEAQILYYGALDNIKNAMGAESVAANASTGTGSFELPDDLKEKIPGEDYYVYLLAEHIREGNHTDYASEPFKVEIKTAVEMITLPRLTNPIPEQELAREMTISSAGVKEKVVLTWKKVDGDTKEEATGNAEWKTTYQAYATLTAADGYSFTDVSGNIAGVIIDGKNIESENITLNSDGSLTVYCGEYTSATRKIEKVEAPKVPKQFSGYYTAENILSCTELGAMGKVTLEGALQPNPKEMEVEWQVVNAKGDVVAYDATPTANNIFMWKIKKDEYADYDSNGAIMEGMVTIQNKDYTPVTITGSDVTVTYDGNATLDVSKYFNLDENAGVPVYELLDVSEGSATLEGKILTITALGNFVIKVTTEVNGVYDKGEHTLSIICECNHAWDAGSVTKEATTTQMGEKTYTCTVCKGIKTEKLPVKEAGNTTPIPENTPNGSVSHQMLPVGHEQKDDKEEGVYKVTSSDAQNATVTYIAPQDSQVSHVVIPSAVVIGGMKYKVTAIEKNAFKNNKKLKSITIGKNIERIGAKAFYGCSKLKKITIKTTKLTTKKVGSKAFGKTPKKMKVKVPKKKFKSYKKMLIQRGVNKKVTFLK